MIRVIAVVVTHNRLQLLQESIHSLKAQLYPVDQIIVINNGSTDGTETWLREQRGVLVHHQENIGASAGFSKGMQLAFEYHPDWFWLMDDDTICQPDSLSMMIGKLEVVAMPIGFLSSKSVWLDGAPHLMNVPAIKPSFNQSLAFNVFDKNNMLLVETSSFVSLLVSSEAVKQVGLPYEEFFIWGDDQEYTRRITKAGYLGLYCIDSIVLHKTPVNYFPDFYRDTVPNLWKHNYGFRNEFFMIKKNRGGLYFFFWLPAKVLYTSAKLLKLRKDNRFKFIKVLFNSALRSIFFNPQIRQLK